MIREQDQMFAEAEDYLWGSQASIVRSCSGER
jgi:hypothetical protein